MNNNSPKISIVLPVYNREKLLPKAIESCLNQTFKDFELIIIDDCSKDKSFEIAKEYAKQDQRIKVIRNEPNKRLPASLNIAFKEARGQYFTWTSDDNLLHENALEKMNDVFGQSILIPVTKKKYDENMTNFSFCPFFLIYTF